MIIAKIESKEITEVDLLLELRLSLRTTIIDEVVNHAIVAAACQELSIEPTRDELDGWLTEFRQQKRLFGEKDLELWLNKNNLVEEHLSAISNRAISQKKLKSHLFDSLLEREFYMRRTEFDRVEYYRIVVAREDAANEIAAQIREGADFPAMARAHSTDKATAKLGGYCGVADRSSLRPEIEAPLCSSQQGELTGPIKSVGSFQLLMLEQLHPAALDDRTKYILQERMFAQWLAMERRKRNVSVTL